MLNKSPEFKYFISALAPAIVIPAPFACPGLIAPFASKMFLSSTFNVAVLIETRFPCTSKSPETVRLLTTTLLPSKAAIAL